MGSVAKSLRFVWWNLQSFAHYEPARSGETQWPTNLDEYAGKRKNVDEAMRVLFGQEPPELLAFAEITRRAAVEMRDRLFPGYKVYSLDLGANPELQVAVLSNNATHAFYECAPVVVACMPRGTRP